MGKAEKICQYCRKIYYVPTSQTNRSKFCSDVCFRASKNKQVDWVCDFCGKNIKIEQNKYQKYLNDNTKKFFCSTECAKNIQKPKWKDIVTLFESYEYILISTEYISAKTRLEYICTRHKDKGSQYVTYNNLKNGCGCKYCGIERIAEKRKSDFEHVRNIFLNNDMVLLDQEYKNSNTPMAYICKHHPEVGVQHMTTSNATKQHCPYCHINKGERKITQYLLNHKIPYKPHKTFDNLYGVGNGKLSYDFYIPEINLLIEFQGEQHEHPVERFGGEEQFVIQQEHDNRKRQYAEIHNINLLEIWYYDFKNIDKILDDTFNLHNSDSFLSSETAV